MYKGVVIKIFSFKITPRVVQVFFLDIKQFVFDNKNYRQIFGGSIILTILNFIVRFILINQIQYDTELRQELIFIYINFTGSNIFWVWIASLLLCSLWCVLLFSPIFLKKHQYKRVQKQEISKAIESIFIQKPSIDPKEKQERDKKEKELKDIEDKLDKKQNTFRDKLRKLFKK